MVSLSTAYPSYHSSQGPDQDGGLVGAFARTDRSRGTHVLPGDIEFGPAASPTVVASVMLLAAPGADAAQDAHEMMALHLSGISVETLAKLDSRARAALLARGPQGERGIDAIYRDPPRYDARRVRSGAKGQGTKSDRKQAKRRVPVYRLFDDEPARVMSPEQWTRHSQQTWNKVRRYASPEALALLRRDLKPGHDRSRWANIIRTADPTDLHHKLESQFILAFLRDMDTGTDERLRAASLPEIQAEFAKRWKARAVRHNQSTTNPYRQAGIMLDPDKLPGIRGRAFADVSTFRAAIREHTVAAQSMVDDAAFAGSAYASTQRPRGSSRARSFLVLGQRHDHADARNFGHEFFHARRGYFGPIEAKEPAEAAHNLREEILACLSDLIHHDAPKASDLINDPSRLGPWIEQKRLGYADICGEDCFGDGNTFQAASGIVLRDLVRAIGTGSPEQRLRNLSTELEVGFPPLKRTDGSVIENSVPGPAARKNASDAPSAKSELPNEPEDIMLLIERALGGRAVDHTVKKSLSDFAKTWTQYLAALHKVGDADMYHRVLTRFRTNRDREGWQLTSGSGPLGDTNARAFVEAVGQPSVPVHPNHPLSFKEAAVQKDPRLAGIDPSRFVSPELAALWNEAVSLDMSADVAAGLLGKIATAFLQANSDFGAGTYPVGASAFRDELKLLIESLKMTRRTTGATRRIGESYVTGRVIMRENAGAGLGRHSFLNDEEAFAGWVLGNDTRPDELGRDTQLLSAEPMGEGLPTFEAAYQLWYQHPDTTPEQRRNSVAYLVGHHTGQPWSVATHFVTGNDEAAANEFIGNARAHHRRTSTEDTFDYGGLAIPRRINLDETAFKKRIELDGFVKKGTLLDDDGIAIVNIWLRGATQEEVQGMLQALLRRLMLKQPVPWTDLQQQARAFQPGSPEFLALMADVESLGGPRTITQAKVNDAEAKAAKQTLAKVHAAADEALGRVPDFVDRLMGQAGKSVRVDQPVASLEVRIGDVPGGVESSPKPAPESVVYPAATELSDRIEAVVKAVPSKHPEDAEAWAIAAAQNAHGADVIASLLTAGRDNGLFGDPSEIGSRGVALLQSPNPELALTLTKDPQFVPLFRKSSALWTDLMRIGGSSLDAGLAVARSVAKAHVLVKASLLDASAVTAALDAGGDVDRALLEAFKHATKDRHPEGLASALWLTDSFEPKVLALLSLKKGLEPLTMALRGEDGTEEFYLGIEELRGAAEREEADPDQVEAGLFRAATRALLLDKGLAQDIVGTLTNQMLDDLRQFARGKALGLKVEDIRGRFSRDIRKHPQVNAIRMLTLELDGAIGLGTDPKSATPWQVREDMRAWGMKPDALDGASPAALKLTHMSNLDALQK